MVMLVSLFAIQKCNQNERFGSEQIKILFLTNPTLAQGQRNHPLSAKLTRGSFERPNAQELQNRGFSSGGEP
ncbi:hypothetical protein DOO74_08960 [Rhodobacteraceae bacterium AsT-22]|nr:hypothetical protein DOO74_08960 [Rhodobacteraceae bacterium AsT-22]